MAKEHLGASEILNSTDSEKFLTFQINNNFYGIPILKVNEIIGLVSITNLPKVPDYFKGVINLRGNIIPVIDLRLKFDIEEKSYDENTCIIIINLEIKNKVKQVGIIVDTVSEVCRIPDVDIDYESNYKNNAQSSFFSGIGKVKDKVIILLDIENIIFAEDFLHALNKMEV